MWVIIRGLPQRTTQRELRRFLNSPYGRRGWFGHTARPEIRLKSASILKMTDQVSGTVERHGLAELESSTPDELILKALNGRQLRGKTLPVRKYYHRANSQALHSEARHPRILPGRSERRRTWLQVELLNFNTRGSVAGLF